jgi:hypothetical protein
MNGPLQLTLNFIFPAGTTPQNYSVTYPNAEGIPIPQVGDYAAAPGGGSFPVKYRTWMYNGPQSLTIALACFDGN